MILRRNPTSKRSASGKQRKGRPSHKRRSLAFRKAKKAKSMQVSYRKASGGELLSIDAAKEIIEAPPECPYCGKTIQWHLLSIDHRTPRSKGGPDAPENLVWVDLPCNAMKGDLMPEDYMTLLRIIQEHPELNLARRLRAGGFMYRRK